jgi:hypothetical protein
VIVVCSWGGEDVKEDSPAGQAVQHFIVLPQLHILPPSLISVYHSAFSLLWCCNEDHS